MNGKTILINNVPLYLVDSTFISIICIESINVPDIGITIGTFRKLFPDVLIQGINPNVIYGKRHILEVMKIILENNARKIRITKRLEMELLLRLVCSNQINKAIEIGGIKNKNPGCFVLISEKKKSISESIKYISNLFKQNNSLLKVTKEKLINICQKLELTYNQLDEKDFTRMLIEKSSLVSL